MVFAPEVKRYATQIQLWMIVFIVLSAASGGCGPKEPSLSEAAYAFKNEMGETVRRLSHLFIEPAIKKDIKAIDTTLEKLFLDAHRKGRPLTFSIVILDKNGITLTYRYPQRACHLTSVLNYSDYSMVAQALKTRRIVQGRLFLQDGTRLYVICAPLLQKDRLEGVLTISMPDSQLNEKLGVSEKEFLSIDFNK